MLSLPLRQHSSGHSRKAAKTEPFFKLSTAILTSFGFKSVYHIIYGPVLQVWTFSDINQQGLERFFFFFFFITFGTNYRKCLKVVRAC
uniref:Uncharacterized protein n=1 Tax=Cucumis sativus TaxID=3659 RepID=A0A0A0KFE1_CUCSA